MCSLFQVLISLVGVSLLKYRIFVDELEDTHKISKPKPDFNIGYFNDIIYI